MVFNLKKEKKKSWKRLIAILNGQYAYMILLTTIDFAIFWLWGPMQNCQNLFVKIIFNSMKMINLMIYNKHRSLSKRVKNCSMKGKKN